MKKTNESGRSMVEMLGVLAIIGVLSVGGIVGYTTAMNKHRANQILNGASVRAIVVSTQIQRGSAAPTLGEFTDADNAVGGATFTGLATWNKDTDKRFSLTLTGVSTEICTQMKAMKGENGIIKAIADDCTTITYNNDMSTGDSTSDTIDSIDTGTCTNGNVWLSYAEEGHECDTTTPQNMGCTKNSDCDSGEYCKITGTWQNACSVITGATCETLDAGTEITYTHSSKTTKLLQGDTMSWWAAENWCKAHHKSLVKASTLGCTCTASVPRGSCPGQVYSDMDSAGLGNYYWTADSYGSCFARYVRVNREDFNYGSRTYDSPYALCE